MSTTNLPGVNREVLRYYDPTTAPFTTPDPLFALTGERFGYADNDPINGTDPLGLCGFLGDGPCTPSGIAKEATNDTISVATGGRADCVRYATCSGSTANAYYSAGDVVDYTIRNRGTIATVGATAWCLIPGLGWASCPAAQSAAYIVRAEQRIDRQGFSNSLGENLSDLGMSAMSLGVGSLPEGLAGFSGMSAGIESFARFLLSGPDIARSIVEACGS
jgi:hypothetical protein